MCSIWLIPTWAHKINNKPTFQDMTCTQMHTGYTQIMCGHVPPWLVRNFHFTTSLVCDGGDKTVVTEMSEEEEKGGLKLNRKLCTSIKTCRGNIKSYTPVPGDRMQNGGTQWKTTVKSESLFSHSARGWKRDRTSMFNNVLGVLWNVQ